MPTTTDAVGVLQIGANGHTKGIAAFHHDPVPFLIKRGWSATLVEPQPRLANRLRQNYAAMNSTVGVVQAAVCPEAMALSVPLYFVNGSRTLGANESDIRCLGDDVSSGTASFSRGLVLSHQRHYRFTPSQCALCAAALGRPLPPNCMRRVYEANLDVMHVPCARAADVLPTGDGGGDGSSAAAGIIAAATARRRLTVLVVDAEGEDDHVVVRLLDMMGSSGPPTVIIYEQVHMRAARRAALAKRLRESGMRIYNRTAMRTPPRGRAAELSAVRWNQLRSVLSRTGPDNAAWIVEE